MTQDDNTARACLFPTGIRSVQLYHRTSLLEADVERCAAAGWEVVSFDASHWGNREALHADLADRLGFPSYYGRNLDALGDSLAGFAEGRYGFPSHAAGGVIVVRNLDALVLTDPVAAAALTEAFIDAAARALRFGWPLACLLQSNDPDLTMDLQPQIPLQWNNAERRRSDRTDG